MKNFNLFIPITKVDEHKRLVWGLATAEQVDKSGEVFDYDSSLPYYKDWSGEIHKASGGKSLGNVREMHTNIAAGKLTQIEFNDEKKQIEVCHKIVNDSTWEKVLEGVLTGFSHGGEYIKTWKDPDNAKITRYTARPAELSVVDNPCLGSATFELLRADGATEMRKFKPQETPMTETVIDGKLAKPKYVPLQKWEASDGKTFEKKADWQAYELELESATAAASAAAPVLNALAELEKAVSEKENLEKKDYSDDERAKMAESGEAMEGGEYPIKTKKDLENAIQAYGRAKDKAKTKAHIEARAKALGAEDMLPESWDENESKKAQLIADLKKSFAEAYDAKTAIEALCIIECLISGEEWEAMMGEGEDGQLADLKEAVSRLKAFIAAEIMEGEEAEKAAAGDMQKAGARHSAADKGHLAKASGAIDKASGHLEDAEKAHGNVGKAHEAMRKSITEMQDCMKGIAPGDLSKLDAEGLAKYRKDAEEGSAKISSHLDDMDGHLDKADKHHAKLGKSHDGIEAAHDAAHHALKAVGAMDGDDEAEKAAHAEMKKAADELTLVKADLTTTQSENVELKKAIDKLNTEVPATIQSLLDRMKKLESQPMPAKGAVFPVVKGHEAIIDPAAPVEATSYSTFGASPAEMREILNLHN